MDGSHACPIMTQGTGTYLDGFWQTTKILSQDGISESRSEPGTSPLQSKNVTHLTMISASHAQLKTFYIC
jgi:hypothetical protein